MKSLDLNSDVLHSTSAQSDLHRNTDRLHFCHNIFFSAWVRSTWNISLRSTSFMLNLWFHNSVDKTAIGRFISSSGHLMNPNKARCYGKKYWSCLCTFLVQQNRRNTCDVYVCVCVNCYKRGLNPFSNKPWFLRVCRANLLKTLWEKEKLLVTSNFSFFHSFFHPFREHSAILIKFRIVVCKLFRLGQGWCLSVMYDGM